MSDNEAVTVIDEKLVDELEKVVRSTAEMICAEQPDVPKPESLTDLDSFSVVQILLELENTLKTKLLERLEGFEGETFRDLAEFIVRLIQQDEEAARTAAEAPAQDETIPA